MVELTIKRHRMITEKMLHDKIDEVIIQFPGEFFEGRDFLDAIEHYFMDLTDSGEINEAAIEPYDDKVVFKVLMPDGTEIKAERALDGGKV